MRVRPRTPNTQGFLNNVRRIRVSEQRQTDQGKSGPNGYPRGGPDGRAVNIPLLAIQAEMRPRSDTAASRRNRRLKDVGRLKSDSTERLRAIG